MDALKTELQTAVSTASGNITESGFSTVPKLIQSLRGRLWFVSVTVTKRDK